MNMDLLDTFLDLVESRNFNQTAHNLQVTQSTVSARIRALEEAVGARLFVRGRGGATLTPAGTRFESYAVNLRLGWNLALQDVGMPAGYRDRLRVAMQVSLWDKLVDAWVAQLRRALPDTAVHVESDYSKPMIDEIVFGNLDVAVIYSPEYRPGLTVDRMFEESYAMIATRPLAIDELAPSEYVFVDASPWFSMRHAELLPRLQHAPLSMGLGSMTIDYLRAHGGAAYLPERVGRPLTASGEFFTVTDAPVIRQPVFVTYLARRRHQPSVRTAIELLAAVDLDA